MLSITPASSLKWKVCMDPREEKPGGIDLERFRVNQEITDVSSALVIIASDGTSLGELPFEKIQEEAKLRGLDIVEVSTAPKSVIKLMDFRKFVEQKKEARRLREKLMGTQPKNVDDILEPKEVQIGLNIDFHDFELKKELIKKFLIARHPVKLVIKLKKSSLSQEARPSKANELFSRVETDLADYLIDESGKRNIKPAPGTLVKFFYPKTLKDVKIMKTAQVQDFSPKKGEYPLKSNKNQSEFWKSNDSMTEIDKNKQF